MDAEQFPNGIWLVELAPIGDPALVPQTVAAVLGLRQEQARPLLEMVTDYLREKNLLLVLDNCEHLIDACAKFADTLLHACPHTRILATSREALGILGEVVWRVPSLTVPDLQILPPAEAWMSYEGIRLFVERATAARPRV